MCQKIDPTNRLILSPQMVPLLPNLRIVQLTRREVTLKILAARVAAIAPWVDMNPAEVHGQLAAADKPA